MKIKSLLKNPIVYGILLIAVVALSLYVQKNVLTSQSSAIQSLSLPSRYAFISDKEKPQLAVVDVFDNQFVQTITLQSRADFLSISRVGGTLVYAEKNSSTIHLLKLDNLNESKIETEAGVKSLLMHGDGFWLSYVTANTVVMHDIVMGNKHQVEIKGETTLAYSPDGLWLFIVEKDSGKITQAPLKGGESRIFEVGQAISSIAIMPDSQGLIFTSAETIYHLSLATGELIKQSFDANFQRPYITNDSRFMLLVDNRDKSLVLFSPQELKEDKRIALNHSNLGEPYTGWLEQVMVIASEKALLSTNFIDDNSVVKTTEVGGEVISAMVMSDSKTLLATIQASKDLLLFDMNSQSVKTTVTLPLEQPNIVLMGQTNTLCH